MEYVSISTCNNEIVEDEAEVQLTPRILRGSTGIDSNYINNKGRMVNFSLYDIFSLSHWRKHGVDRSGLNGTENIASAVTTHDFSKKLLLLLLVLLLLWCVHTIIQSKWA